MVTNCAFFFGALVVVEAQLRHRDAVLQRPHDARRRSGGCCAAARSFRSCSSRALISSLLIVCRNRSSAFFDISRRRNSHSSRSRPGVRISSADPASLPGPRRARRPPAAASPRSARAAARTASARRRASPPSMTTSDGAVVVPRAGGRSLRGVDLGVDGGAEARQRRERGQVRELAGEHERERDVRPAARSPRRRARRERTACSSGRRTPPSGSP